MRARRARSGGFGSLQALEQRVLFSNFPPLIPPVGLTAIPRNSTTVNLSWDATRTIGESGIRVERSTNGFNWVTAVSAPANSSAWIDSGLEPDTTYFYRIAAFAPFGTFYAGGFIQVATPPGAPVELDDNLTIFIEREAATDPVIIEDQFGSLQVTVGAEVEVFDIDDVRDIRLLRSTSDNGLTITRLVNSLTEVQVSSALTVRGSLNDDMVGISGNTDFIVIKINEANITISKTLIDRLSVLTYEGNDRISIGDNVGGVHINGGSGDDTIFGNTGDDKLYGGPGNDLIKGNAGNDRLYGDAGNDIIYGQAGNDYLEGGNGEDKLVGGIGDDLLKGGDGNDRLYGEAGVDTLDGGLGLNLLRQD